MIYQWLANLFLICSGTTKGFARASGCPFPYDAMPPLVGGIEHRA
jgi:hypothetical protein